MSTKEFLNNAFVNSKWAVSLYSWFCLILVVYFILLAKEQDFDMTNGMVHKVHLTYTLRLLLVLVVVVMWYFGHKYIDRQTESGDNTKQVLYLVGGVVVLSVVLAVVLSFKTKIPFSQTRRVVANVEKNLFV